MLRDMLKAKGVRIGRKHVSTLMKRMGIEALYRRPNTSKRHPKLQIYPYLLKDLKIERANKIWATDITYILMKRGFVYLYAGAPDRVLESYEDDIEAGYLVPFSNALLWHPTYAPTRKTDRFKTFARKSGLVDYWRARGWPDLCRPIGTDDFTCD